ncbi:unnamed protein product, partial [Rotaria sp. Silwood1]
MHTVGLNSHPKSMAIVDFNNDAQLDIVVTNLNTKNVELLLGNDNGTFLLQKGYQIDSNFTPFVVAAGDFNNDRRSDIVVAYDNTENVDIFITYDIGFFTNATTYPTGSQPQSVVVGDFNNDTILDIVVCNSYDNT